MSTAITDDGPGVPATAHGIGWRATTVAHAVSLLLIPCVLVPQLVDQWFYWDEFEYLGSTRDYFSVVENLLRPHNEHWSLLTGLFYGVLKSSVGMRSYWPYLLPVLVVHVLTVHLLWRVMVRLGSSPWIATALALVFGVVGAGYENVVWAFQIAFVASTACGLACVLIVLGSGAIPRGRQIPLTVLATVNLTISGLGIVWLAVCALLLWKRKGLRATTLVMSVPLLASALHGS